MEKTKGLLCFLMTIPLEYLDGCGEKSHKRAFDLRNISYQYILTKYQQETPLRPSQALTLLDLESAIYLFYIHSFSSFTVSCQRKVIHLEIYHQKLSIDSYHQSKQKVNQWRHHHQDINPVLLLVPERSLSKTHLSSHSAFVGLLLQLKQAFFFLLSFKIQKVSQHGIRITNPLSDIF